MDLGISRTSPDPTGLAHLTVTGDLDDETAGQLTTAVTRCLDELPADLRVDLAATGFLSSAGVRALLGCREAALAAGCTLRLTNPQPRVHLVLEIVGVLALFGLDPAPALPGQRPRFTGRPKGSPRETARAAQATRSDAQAVLREAQSRAKARDILRSG